MEDAIYSNEVKKMMKLLQRKQHGIGLLELMLSLAIIVILLVMATRYFLVASLNEKVNTMISTVGGYNAAFTCTHGDRTDANLNAMSDAGCLSSQLWVPGTGSTTTTGPWGNGTWTVPTATGPGILTYTSLPEKGCKALANKYLNDANAKFNNQESKKGVNPCIAGNNTFTYEIH